MEGLIRMAALVGIFLAVLYLLTWVFMHAWNFLAPDFGLPQLTLWKAFVLSCTCQWLFSTKYSSSSK